MRLTKANLFLGAGVVTGLTLYAAANGDLEHFIASIETQPTPASFTHNLAVQTDNGLHGRTFSLEQLNVTRVEHPTATDAARAVQNVEADLDGGGKAPNTFQAALSWCGTVAVNDLLDVDTGGPAATDIKGLIATYSFAQALPGNTTATATETKLASDCQAVATFYLPKQAEMFALQP